ncbi:conserved unknown protein [Ectocarpus siliculosus]|uniref:Uncharacterized protein n=1 Tax=Ectocarpus siliculosus TaxID=2880 RepID=D7FPY5_ECTSI|nr:conserved unknown protein [Ectocarpus siliculosus]|eukprot:CBJ48317.1 conserved unknown protein [Ectocarpus siliculosus]
MRRHRLASASPPWMSPFFSSWKSLVLTCLALSQVITIYLLLRIAGNGGRDEQPQHPVYTEGVDPDYHDRSAGPIPPSTRKSLRRVLSVAGSSASSTAAAAAAAPRACVPRTISPGVCSDEERGVRRPEQNKRETCVFELDKTEVVFGVWHSLATEGRLQPLLETWGRRAQVVLLASSVGVRESKLFREGVPGSRPHLLDTGIEQDDYFSTLGKAFVGLRLMLDAYPTKKWFVVLGDDNYVLLDNYINALSAFDPEEPLALSRMVHRNKFGCKVAGGASVITSRAMTRQLSPHLEPWYQGIVERSGGDVNKATEEDKFHDIAFQKLVEHLGHSWVHLDELPHEPPGYYFDPRLGVSRAVGGGGGGGGGGAMIPERSALFHYVPGKYMHYLDFVSWRACTCGDMTPAQTAEALSEVAIGVYSPTRRLSKLDEKRIEAAWGRPGGGLRQRRMLAASGREHAGVRGDLARLRELSEAFPDAGWLLLLPVEHYLVAANLAARIRTLEADKSPGRRGLLVYGPPGNAAAAAAAAAKRQILGDNFTEEEENAEDLPGEGALLIGKDLVETTLYFGESLAGGVFPARRQPGDRFLVEWARTLSAVTVVQDSGFVRRLPAAPAGAGAGGPEKEEEEEEHVVGCPATFPMEPDLADLKPEFTMSEGDAVMAVTGFLLRASAERTSCTPKLEMAEIDVYN